MTDDTNEEVETVTVQRNDLKAAVVGDISGEAEVVTERQNTRGLVSVMNVSNTSVRNGLVCTHKNARVAVDISYNIDSEPSVGTVMVTSQLKRVRT